MDTNRPASVLLGEPARVTGSDVSVVICAYLEERWSDLLEAVASAVGQTLSPREVIVAVDHNDRLLERLRAEMPGIRIVSSTGPRGKPGALDAAVTAATGSVIALLDDDARAEPTWLEELVGAYADPRALGVGGSIHPLWSVAAPRWFPREFLWVVGCTYRGMPAGRAEVRNLIGANMSFRRQVFMEVGRPAGSGIGGPAEQLVSRLAVQDAASRHALEDTELCLRASQRWPDGRWLYEPRARVRHHVPASRGSWPYFRSRCYVEGLAKAGLARAFGSGRALESERRYVARTLPTGVLRSLADVVVRRDLAGFARAGAIVAGTAITTAGYVRGRLASIDRKQHEGAQGP